VTVASRCAELSQDAQPRILDESPNVLSVGRRCVHEGFGFAWLSGELPCLIDPSGAIVQLDAQHDAPCLQSGPILSKAVKPSRKRAIPSRVVIEDLSSIDIVLPPGLTLLIQLSDIKNQRALGSTSLICDSTNLIPERFSACKSAAREPANVACLPGVDAAAEPVLDPLEPAVIDATPPMPPPEVLKHDVVLEAQSLEHLLYHRFKNPYYDVCKRGVLRNVRSARGSFDQNPTAWGDLLADDHIDSKRAEMKGVNEEREAICIKDVLSGRIRIYPVAPKSADDTILSLRRFIDKRPVNCLYSDRGCAAWARSALAPWAEWDGPCDPGTPLPVGPPSQLRGSTSGRAGKRQRLEG
jgi:hypothetical protein